MSGLEINFAKSEVLIINGDDDKNPLYAELFNCQIGNFPLKYLGVPVSRGRLHVCDWNPLPQQQQQQQQQHVTGIL